MAAADTLRPEQDTLATGLGIVYSAHWSGGITDLLFYPDSTAGRHTISGGLDVVEHLTGAELPSWLLPLAWSDEESIACVVTEDRPSYRRGEVRRLLLREVSPAQQLRLLDIDPLLYVSSADEELASRTEGLARILDQIGPAYEENFLAQAKRPRDYIVRPVRIACQNVIVALAAIAQDSTFDGLAVAAWQTCEVPHVATHEANRALTALTLCDAFARGGTMEIRFDRPATVTLGGRSVNYAGHPEMRVPAGLRRFARTVGVTVGVEDPAAITPREARELFLAVTPMPAGLRERVNRATDHSGLSPERACYTLLSQVWREVELDMLLATTEHAPSILAGGAAWTDRAVRQAESHAARAAVMAGMYYRRLDGRDTAAASDGLRVVEDVSAGVTWTIDEVAATMTFELPVPAPAPWSGHGRSRSPVTALTVAPRVHVSDADLAHLRACGGALLLPQDVAAPRDADDVPVLRCPDRLADLDKAIEDKLLAARIARA